MGNPSAEQTVAVIEAVAEVVENTKTPENYWWLLSLTVIPVILAWWLNRNKGND